jgi:hypothetical protein
MQCSPVYLHALQGLPFGLILVPLHLKHKTCSSFLHFLPVPSHFPHYLPFALSLVPRHFVQALDWDIIFSFFIGIAEFSLLIKSGEASFYFLGDGDFLTGLGKTSGDSKTFLLGVTKVFTSFIAFVSIYFIFSMKLSSSFLKVLSV